MGNRKNFNKELAVGFIGIIALLLIYFLINFFKGIDLFKNGERYYVKFENIGELVGSSPVFLNGYKAGNVQGIHYDFESMNEIVVTIEIDKRLQIPVGSVAKITTHMLGSADISIIMAKNNIFYQPGDTLHGVLDKGIAGEANDKIIPTLNNMLPKIDSILTATNRLLSNPSIAATIENAEELTKELQATTKQLNNLLADDLPQITEKIINIEDDMLTMSSQLREVDYKHLFMALDTTISNMQHLTAALKNGEGTAGMLLKDSTLYNNLNKTCEAANELLTNLRENPKRYVHFSVFGRKEK